MVDRSIAPSALHLFLLDQSLIDQFSDCSLHR